MATDSGLPERSIAPPGSVVAPEAPEEVDVGDRGVQVDRGLESGILAPTQARLPSLWLYALVGLILVVEVVVGLRLYIAEPRRSDTPTDLSGSYLDGQVLSDAWLSGVLFRGSSLEGVVFTGSMLRDADFSRACLRDAHLEYADLSSATFAAADLRGVDFSGAVFADGTLFTAAVYDDTTLWVDGPDSPPIEAIHASKNPWMACDSAP